MYSKDTIKSIKKFYPGWILRVHPDSSISKNLKCELECIKDDKGEQITNLEFCDIEKMPGNQNQDDIRNWFNRTWNASYIHAMKWRWFPIRDHFVDAFMSRDSDSVFIQREIDSVNVWLKSNKAGHIMRGSFVFT